MFIIRIILTVLSWWLFKIPQKFTVFALVFYFILFSGIKGEQPMYLFQRELESKGTIAECLFWVGIGFPLFWSFISAFASTSNYGNKNLVDSILRFRNGQMDVATPKKAYNIFKRTAMLDVMKEHQGEHIYDKAMQGFKAMHGNDSPTTIYKELLND